MKVYTLNSFARNNETGRFTEYYDNHGVFIMRNYAEQFSTEHDLEHREWFGETLRYVIEELLVNFFCSVIPGEQFTMPNAKSGDG